MIVQLLPADPGALSIHTLAPSAPLPTPAELAHYKSLFSKLRFSYTEQVTKERLLKSLVADPPELAPLSGTVLAQLEADLADDKAGLKAKKAAVQSALADLDALSRRVAREAAELETLEEQLGLMPEELDALRAEVERLRPEEEEEEQEDPRLRMGLAQTVSVVDERRKEAEQMEAEIAALRSAVDDRRRDVDRLRGEAGLVEERKRGLVEEVRGLQRRGAEGDELERRGRWARAQVQVLEGLVG